MFTKRSGVRLVGLLTIVLAAGVVTAGAAPSRQPTAPLAGSLSARVEGATAHFDGTSSLGASSAAAAADAHEQARARTDDARSVVELVPARPATPAEAAAIPVAVDVSTPPPPAPAKPAPTKPSYSGVNHVWIPSLGMSYGVRGYACGATYELANVVYRWACGGRNNVYLMGHAWGVFKPLHDAYYSGRLRVGMKVVFADAAGRVRSYFVKAWRVVWPSDSAWAIASQPVPSMTLQTCIGANSEKRLVVRLVAGG